MDKKKIWATMLIAAISVMMVLAMTACGNETSEVSKDSKDTDKETTQSTRLSDSDMQVLMDEVANSEQEKQYADEGLPDEVFANAEVFGIDREGDKGTAYVILNTGEYVALDSKAYFMSGSEGEAIVKFEYTENGPKLSEVEWSADGEDHDKWLKDNFPEEYLKKANKYEVYNKDGNSKLTAKMNKTVEEEMGVPVETDLQLNIDQKKKTYEIIKTKESGDPASDDYKFDTQIIEQGKLGEV